MSLLSRITNLIMPSNNLKRPITRSAWGPTTNAFFYSLFGTLLPGIIALLILGIFNRLDLIPTLIEKGDFYLYSAGLLSTGIYLLNENKDKLLFVDKLINPLALVALIFSGIIYGVLYTSLNLFNSNMLAQHNISVSKNFITYSSYTLLLAAIFIAYRALYIETKKNISFLPIDVRAESRQDVNDIASKIGSENAKSSSDLDTLMDQLGNE